MSEEKRIKLINERTLISNIRKTGSFSFRKNKEKVLYSKDLSRGKSSYLEAL